MNKMNANTIRDEVTRELREIFARPCRDPGDYYDQKRREADLYYRMIEKLRELEPKPMGSGEWTVWYQEIRRLNRKLDAARYTGD